MLSNLGIALTARFERTGDQADLDAAIDAGQQALAATPADDPDRAGRLSNLGVALTARFERTGDRADLDAAIDLPGRRWRPARPTTPTAPDGCPTSAPPCGPGLSGPGTGPTWTPRSTPAGRRWRPARPATPTAPCTLSNLGLALRTRFERTGDRADLDAAIDAGQQAVAASPADHPDRAGYLSNLGNALRTRFERTGDQADLDAAIDLSAGRRWRPPRPTTPTAPRPVQPRPRPADPV